MPSTAQNVFSRKRYGSEAEADKLVSDFQNSFRLPKQLYLIGIACARVTLYVRSDDYLLDCVFKIKSK